MTTFIKTMDMLNALSVALIALQLPAQYSALPDYPKLFQGVLIWSEENIIAALQKMYDYSDRACIIVPGGDDHKSERAGDVLRVTRTSQVHLLIGDRNYGMENLGLIGEAGSNPGVIAMKDIVIDALTGPSINVKNVVLVPESGEPMTIFKVPKTDTDPGRVCWGQTFNTYAGKAKVAIR